MTVYLRVTVHFGTSVFRAISLLGSPACADPAPLDRR